MGVNVSQIATRNNLLNDLGYRVSSSNATKQCVTGEFVDSLNTKPSITTDNYSSNKTYSTFTTAQILKTTIVEKKYTALSVTPVNSSFALNTAYAASKFENTNIWSIDISKVGENTDTWMSSISMNFSLTGTVPVPVLTADKIYIDVGITIGNNSSYNFSSGYGEIKIPSSGTSTASTTVSTGDIERNINFTPDYLSNYSYTDFNGIQRAYSPNTAYVLIYINVYVYDSSSNKTYINIPSNLKITFTNTPTVKARCKSKLVKFSTLSDCKAVLPFRFGLLSKVTALSVDNMYLYGHVPTGSTSTTFTKVTLASHTGLSNTGSGNYKKYLDYIVIDPSSTLTPEKFVNTSSYASFKAGTTTGKRAWRVYLVYGDATDFTNVSSTDIGQYAYATQATSINETLGDPAVDLVKVIRDNWGVMLEVMS